MSTMSTEEDTFKILVATDNHLGYGEKKPIIDNDSFRAFEEILQLAVKNEVDFILLGGDLFHESQPSPYCMHKCTELLKKYCLGDKPVAIEFLSDQSEHFYHLQNPIVNYEDPNMNVCLPVFSIHGNHDNPTGNNLISALDILSGSGLVNYFGRWTNLSEIEIKPILLKKGNSKLALYGLSHIPDQRLARLFQEKKVKMPQIEGDWFNLLVLHQNRANRGVKNFIPSNFIPGFMDLVIWGHEHDCNIKPDGSVKDIYISQPGSSVATSLSEGESVEKHVGLLIIYNNQFRLIPIPLKSVRPFLFTELVLCKPESDEYNYDNPQEQALNEVKTKVKEILEKAAQKQRDSQNPLLPLVRLMVRYYNELQTFNPIKLGHEYEGRVANPSEMFKLDNIVARERRRKSTRMGVEEDEFKDVDEWATRVEDVVERYFRNYSRSDQMKVLSAKLMTTAVSRFVDVSDNDALQVAYHSQVNKTIEKLIEKDPDTNGIADCLKVIREERINDEDKEVRELMKEFENENRRILINDDDDIVDVDQVDLTSAIPARGRGSRGGRVARAPRRPRRAARAQ